MEPYITPRKLLGDKILPVPCYLAFICYCPMSDIFNKYKISIDSNGKSFDLKSGGRYFIHTHNDHIMICKFKDTIFIVDSFQESEINLCSHRFIVAIRP